jgi:DNA-binding transcriptional regulator YiaG
MTSHRHEPERSCAVSVDFLVEVALRSRPMAPEDIKALREELSCTARELAAALGLEQDEVLSWERGDLFPTKRLVGKMEELRKRGPAAIPRKKKSALASPHALLADPTLWQLLRKLIAHPELRAAVVKLAEPYADPAEPTKDNG